MNRSYRKIRHIKQSNILLEQRLVNENIEKVIGKSEEEIEERVNTVVGYIRNYPTEKDIMLRDLENIKRGLWGKEWVGETESDYYQLWNYHYQGFTRENMEKLIDGVNAKLGTEEVDKIIAIAKAFLQKNPTYKDFLLQSLT
jgi:hypothetical protein